MHRQMDSYGASFIHLDSTSPSTTPSDGRFHCILLFTDIDKLSISHSLIYPAVYVKQRKNTMPSTPYPPWLQPQLQVYSFATGGSMLTFPCSHVAMTAPSLARRITPWIAHIVRPACTTSLSTSTRSPSGTGRMYVTLRVRDTPANCHCCGGLYR